MESKKKLAIICAGEEEIPLVNKAKEMGIETHCFAWDKAERYYVCKGIADAYHPISILEKERILEVCKEIGIDGVFTHNSFAVPTAAYVAQGMGLIGNSYEDMVTVSNKFPMRQAFEKHGVKSPRFVIAREGMDLSGFRYPLIVKPTDRSSSVGILKVNAESELQDAVRKAMADSYSNEAIIEEYITGNEIGVDSISWNGKHYLLATKEKEFVNVETCQVLAKHYPAQFSPEIQDRINAETIKSLDAINFKYGAANTQFIITEAGEVFSIEINPFLTNYGKQIKFCLGYDYLKGVIDVALGKFEEPVFAHKKFSGKYYLYKETEWVRQVIENKDNDPDIVEAELFEESEVYNGKLGYFIYQSEQPPKWKKK